jgi:glycogen debranching enzyme
LFLTIGVCDGAPARSFQPRLREARRAQRMASARAATVATSNAVLDEVLRRSLADLRMLMTDTPHGPYPYAGIPWFSTAFGRDGLLTALQMLWIDPSMARGVLRFLAGTQATCSDPVADAQPGKILHEMRQGEMAELGEVPFRRYYGSVDSTPLFVLLAGAYLDRTGDLATLRALWPHVLAALDWMDRFGDRDGDGLIEYHRESPTGLINQGWKDAADAVFHASGALATGPIALCEVQGYAWQARLAAARIARALDDAETAAVEERRAERLRRRFEEAFWCEEIGTYALALDGAKRPCRVRTSNAGQVLFTGLATPERARSVAGQLLGRAMFSGWGIRTVASDEARYNPMSYHNGSIWPHDNALIALGFRRYGLVDEACRVFTGIFDAAAYMDLRRLPELFCGFRRRAGSGPTFYPVACAPQAWASAAPFALLQACIGIEFDPAAGVAWFRRPRLPHFLDEVRIRGLSLPQGRLDIVLRRYGADVSVNVLDREGPVSAAVAL